jgi:hypothetical protein
VQVQHRVTASIYEVALKGHLFSVEVDTSYAVSTLLAEQIEFGPFALFYRGSGNDLYFVSPDCRGHDRHLLLLLYLSLG